MLIFAIALWGIVRLAERVRADVSGLTVDLGYSKYRGTALGNGVSQWLGIRYAAPPLGDLRFRVAQDPPMDTTLQNADKHGPLCLPTPSTSLSHSAQEDCLFLDVYAPSNKDQAHPVFVFFQGGGFNTLSSPNLNGSSLIEAGNHDIVVVTFNYRVGPWGFLACKEVQANGDLNVGLKDQRKVLMWVQKYISMFGGDPNHVTIGGVSAGAASVDLHLSAYGGRDDGLFHAAAAESQSFGAQFTVQESQYQYDALVARTGCDAASDTLKCLRDLDVQVLAENNAVIPTPGGGGGDPVYMYSNVIDDDFITNYTYNLFSQGHFVKVPVIFGDSTNEGTVFTPTSISDIGETNDFLRNNWPKLNDTHLTQIDLLYPQDVQFPNSGAFWRTAADVYGEMRYICPGIYINSAYDSFGVTENWNYRWDVASSADLASGYGVTHAAELGSIWGTSGPPDSALTPSIQAYWTSFIRSKDPNTFKLAESPVWEIFNQSTMRRVHFPNDPSQIRLEMVPLDQRHRCAYLSGIGAAIGQ